MGSTTLVMFSGGKDSFLAAVREVTNGQNVVLISFDGGALVGHRNLRYCANRLTEHFGRRKVSYVGCYRTVGTLNRLKRYWVNAQMCDLGKEYPNMTNCQFQCLHCQTAMWVAAIAYAKAKDIKSIACGYKACDEFCTGQPRYITAIARLAALHGIEVSTPVYSIESDYERDVEMGLHGFEPTACEAKCLLGQPALDGRSPALFEDMMRYYENHMRKEAELGVERLVSVFQHIKLDDIPEQEWGNDPNFCDN